LAIPLLLYSVDDPVLALPEDSPVRRLAADALKDASLHAEKVFAITEHLAETINALTRKTNAIPLSLPYLIERIDHADKNNCIIFVGNINKIYASAFVETVRAIDEVRRLTNIDVHFRVTADVSVVSDVLGVVPSFVRAGRIASRAALGAEIASSILAVCPVSFGEPMGASSFPSKVLDYLAYSDNILVYAPRGSSVEKYFAANGLPTVIADGGILAETISHLILHPVSQRPSYLAALARHNGIETFRQKVLAID